MDPFSLFNFKIPVQGISNWLFPKPKTMKEVMREQKRLIARSIKTLETEYFRMKQEEKKQILEMKGCAKKGEMTNVREMAKNLVRTRGYSQRFLKMKTQLTSTQLRLAHLSSQQAMFTSLRSITRTMMVMNRVMNMPLITHMLQEFERQIQQLDMKEEEVNSAIDDAHDSEEQKQDEEVLVNQILDEIGIGVSAQMANTPQTSVTERGKVETTVNEDEELLARLNNLKGGK